MKFPKAIRPLFLLALGLHAGLLLIPTTGSSDQVIPAPDPEIETISITRIPPEETSESIAVTSKPAPQSATQPVQSLPRNPVQSGARQRTAAEASAIRIAQQPASIAGRNRSQPREQSNGTNRGASATPDQSSTPSAHSSSDIPNLSSSSSPRNNSEASRVATPSTAPQAPLTLAALASKATLDLPNSLTRLADWFNQVYTYSNHDTSDQEEAEARQRWIVELRERSGLTTLEPQALEKSIQVSYPLEKSVHYERDFVNCLVQQPHQASVGVFFNAAGDIQSEPSLLRSTGYEFLNQEALELVKNYEDFPVLKAQKAYLVAVEINYDSQACLALTNVQQTP